MKAEDMVNLERYPFFRAEDGVRNQFIESCRNQYQTCGLCELPEFILPDVLGEICLEAERSTEQAWYCNREHNAYLDPSADKKGHSIADNAMEYTYVGSVAYDNLKQNGLLKKLYQWDPLKDFVGDVLGISPFYRLDDPLGACSINVFVDGGEHGWHFDESEFTITLMLQSPQSGGEFEYVPLIRGKADEKEVVGQIIAGDRKDVIQLPFTPGTLLIFGGHHTLHRVAKVSGDTPRLVPVLCYADSPGQRNSETVQKLFWGRAA